jgi:predicted aminopeptidase
VTPRPDRDRLRGVALRAALIISLIFQPSCATITYVTQAAVGQDDLNRRARDIDELVREQRVDARMRRILSQVTVMKHFGERYGLSATTNYTKYVRVDGPAVVWVVSASEPLQFRSKSWSFPFVGSFTYLGWFKLDRARAFASDLEREGWDVDVRGAAAYSTTGYFEDAVLSSMIPRGKEAVGQLANTILHESAHATIFVRHQSTLNESVANFVGDKLGALYVDETLGPESDEARAYTAYERTAALRGSAMRATYQSLKVLYASSKTDAEKLAEKKALLAQLRASLHFRRPITNATLIQYRTYNSGQAELGMLLDACGGDWPRFIRALKGLEATPFDRSQRDDVGAIILPLVEARCPG